MSVILYVYIIYFHVFIVGLFRDTFTSSDYIASNGRVISVYRIGGIILLIALKDLGTS